jgi:hypothetical protein
LLLFIHFYSSFFPSPIYRRLLDIAKERLDGPEYELEWLLLLL